MALCMKTYLLTSEPSGQWLQQPGMIWGTHLGGSGWPSPQIPVNPVINVIVKVQEILFEAYSKQRVPSHLDPSLDVCFVILFNLIRIIVTLLYFITE